MKQRKNLNIETKPRICKRDGCENILVQRGDERNDSFLKRKCCCKSCAAKVCAAVKHKSKYGHLKEDRECLVCGTRMTRTRYKGGDMEPWKNYMEKKTCGRSCQSKFINKRKKGDEKTIFQLAKENFTTVDFWLTGSV